MNTIRPITIAGAILSLTSIALLAIGAFQAAVLFGVLGIITSAVALATSKGD